MPLIKFSGVAASGLREIFGAGKKQENAPYTRKTAVHGA
jgi:hypothetical protein